MTKESDDENDRIRQGTSQVNVNSQCRNLFLQISRDRSFDGHFKIKLKHV